MGRRRGFARRALLLGLTAFMVLFVVVPTLLAILANTLGVLHWSAPSPSGSPWWTEEGGYRGGPWFGLIVLLFVVGIIALARWVGGVASPVGDLIEAAGRLEEGDYRVRVVERGPRDVRALAHAFNTMASRLEASEERRRALFADVSHELRTPLAVIQGNLEGIVDGVYPADAAHVGAILDETRVLSRLIEDLRTLSLADVGALRLHREPTNVGVLVREVVASLRPHMESAAVTIETSVAPVPQVNVDPVRIREVLMNLITNALRYSSRGGRIAVEVDVEQPWLRVSVHDTGPGIPTEMRDRLFERFAKTDDSSGAGLGLAIARSIVVAHGGEIAAESAPDQGTVIRFSLPLS